MFKGKSAGHIDFGLAGHPPQFAAWYLIVDAKMQRRGIGEALLRALVDEVPPEFEYINFYQVSSQGMLRLIEKVFGEVEANRSWLPAEMTKAQLRRSRGINIRVKVR